MRIDKNWLDKNVSKGLDGNIMFSSAQIKMLQVLFPELYEKSGGLIKGWRDLISNKDIPESTWVRFINLNLGTKTERSRKRTNWNIINSALGENHNVPMSLLRRISSVSTIKNIEYSSDKCTITFIHNEKEFICTCEGTLIKSITLTYESKTIDCTGLDIRDCIKDITKIKKVLLKKKN